MTAQRPPIKSPIRLSNDHLAEAHRFALEAGRRTLAASILRIWQKVEAEAEKVESNGAA